MTTGRILYDITEFKFEWEIKDFLHLPFENDKQYKSPEFFFWDSDRSWQIWICPNGTSDSYYEHDSVGWISLFIAPMSLSSPISVDISFFLKTAGGETDAHAKYTSTEVFEEERVAFGAEKFMRRSSLIERKSELLPSGILTVICTLKKSGTNTNNEAGVLKLQQNFNDILSNGNISDVVLNVDGQEFKSHRCILAARSPVFLAMMTHDTKEKETGVVDIQDGDRETFVDFLKYVYTGNDEIITTENVANLYTTANKYQVEALHKSCCNYMVRNISVDNFCNTLRLSLLYGENELTNACFQFYIENALRIVKTPKFQTFYDENPKVCYELFVKVEEERNK